MSQFNELVYHQTLESREAAIRKHGFDLKIVESRSLDDDIPDGIYTKDSLIELPIHNGKKTTQIPLYITLKNPLIVENRVEIKKHVTRDGSYNKSIESKHELEKSFSMKLSMWKNSLDNVANIQVMNIVRDRFDKDYNEGIRHLSSASALARGIMTNRLKQAGYDGVIINNDGGYKSVIAFDSRNVRIADKNMNRQIKVTQDSVDVCVDISTKSLLNNIKNEFVSELNNISKRLGA